MNQHSRQTRAAPTSNVNAEKIVLGALMRSEHDFFQISDVINASSFSVPLHREIFTALADILMAGRKLSLTVLGTRLPEEADGQSVAAYLAALVANAEGLSATDFAETVAEAAARRRLRSIAAAIEKAAVSGDRMPLDVAADAEAAILDVMQAVSPKRPRLLYDLAGKVTAYSIKTQEGGDLPGFDTGLSSLDEITGLLMPGDLVAVLGAQGDGKSALGVQIGMRAAERKPVIMFQYEMQDEQVAARELAKTSNLTVREIHEGAFTFDKRENLKVGREALRRSMLWVLDDTKLTMRQMRAHCLAMKRTLGLGMIVVDHLRLVKVDTKKRDRWERQEEVTGELKSLAKELGIPIILLVQRTRTSQRRDDPTPQIDDAEAPSLEQDCDVIIGVWREASWLQRNKPSAKASQEEKSKWFNRKAEVENLAEVICLKRRRGRAFEQRILAWDGQFTRFSER